MIRAIAAPDDALLTRFAALHAAAFAPARGWSVDEIGALAAAGRLYADCGPAAFALFAWAVDEAELLTLAVHPSRRREGRAAALLAHAAADLAANGARSIRLDVAADNAPARALYAGAGFAGNGARPGYYTRAGGRVDAILMIKALA